MTLVKLEYGERGRTLLLNDDSVESVVVEAEGVVALVTRSGARWLVRGSLLDVACKLGFVGSLGPEPADATRCDAKKVHWPEAAGYRDCCLPRHHALPHDFGQYETGGMAK